MRTPRATFVCAAIACAIVAVSACETHARGFALFARAFLDSARTPAARVTVEVPFRSLVFKRREGLFDSHYTVYLSLQPTDGAGKTRSAVLRGSALARSYDETALMDRRSRVSRVFEVEPGDYVVGARLVIRDTNIEVSRSVRLRVPDFLASGIGVGTPVVLRIPASETTVFATWGEYSSDRVARYHDGPDQPTELFDTQPAVRFDIFSSADAIPPDCHLYYEVLDPTREQVLYGRREIDLTGGDDSYLLGFNVDDWEPGTYTVNLRVMGSDPNRQASSSVDVNVDVTRAMLGRRFDETMEVLSLIASRDELRALRNAAPEDRDEEWVEFWGARDPDRTTERNEALEEHLRRVRFVMEHYGSVGPGWRSDRGQVYIRHGTPDRIERTTDARNRGEYEVWRYYGRGLTFVFYDMFGVGDFRRVEGDFQR